MKTVSFINFKLDKDKYSNKELEILFDRGLIYKEGGEYYVSHEDCSEIDVVLMCLGIMKPLLN